MKCIIKILYPLRNIVGMQVKMAPFVCIQDFENYALNNLAPVVRDYYKSGAGEENTLRWNKEAFKEYVCIYI
jgi:hypothetical protein